MRKFTLAFALTGLALAACATSASADTAGFYDDFSFLSQNRWQKSEGWANGDHQGCEWRYDAIALQDKSVKLTLSDHGGQKRPYGCPEMRTKERLTYGVYEARIRSAAGSGLNTGFFTYIGPPNGVAEWDEIDFEFLGKDPNTVSINHFTNGKPYDGKVVQLGFDASKDFHNYAFEWMPDKIRWYADGKLIAETPQGSKIPHNPGYMFLTLWSGSKQEDAWMGPFQYKGPVSAEFKWTAYTPLDAPCQFPESLKCVKK